MLAQETEFLAAALRGSTSLADLNGMMNRYYAEFSHASPQERDAALAGLAELIALDDLKRAGGVALLCGAMVEEGCDPSPLGERLISRLEQAFETRSEATVEAFWKPAIATFSVSPKLRADGRVLAAPAAKMACQGAHWLNTMFKVLDDEPVLIIEPATHLGVLGRISGVVTNFQLNDLIMDAFPQADPAAPRRISQEAADVAKGIGPQQIPAQITGAWNPSTWKSLAPDLSFREGHEHWIWNEGIPSDIPLFEGRRAILLAPRTYLRSWQATRTFPRLPAKLEIERQLEPNEIRGWLERMAAAAA